MHGQHTPGRTSVSLLVHHVGTGDTPSTPSCSWCLSFVVPGPHRASRRGECCGGACEPPHWSCDDLGRPGHVPWMGLTSQRTPQLSCECRVEVCVTRSGRGPPAHTVSCLPSLLPEQSPSKWYWKLVPVSDLRAPAASRQPSCCSHSLPLNIRSHLNPLLLSSVLPGSIAPFLQCHRERDSGLSRLFLDAPSLVLPSVARFLR